MALATHGLSTRAILIATGSSISVILVLLSADKHSQIFVTLLSLVKFFNSSSAFVLGTYIPLAPLSVPFSTSLHVSSSFILIVVIHVPIGKVTVSPNTFVMVSSFLRVQFSTESPITSPLPFRTCILSASLNCALYSLQNFATSSTVKLSPSQSLQSGIMTGVVTSLLASSLLTMVPNLETDMSF
ncbi:MAG: hypothetical protein A4E25_00021 [Methanobacterium sp. PtaB.Bin024]|nr:MAG: hypothetical protein A4E25_00021 [Methanobacterium sp. PtaB.Bin024]